MTTRASSLSLICLVSLSGAAMAGCAAKSDASSSDAIQVTSADSSCDISRTDIPAGSVNLVVHNKGSKVTEVYVFAPGDRIVTERENIGPGTKATITAQIKPGSYEIACKPGMKGDGIRQKITVVGSGTSQAHDPRLDSAVAQYRAYAQEQADQTIPAVKEFAAAIKAGQVAAAKALFAPSRVGWERAEPVAESFGDIDPKTDTREDGLAVGQKWTGWHRLEKSLWVDGKIGVEEKTLADQLVVDLTDWQKRVGSAEITATSMANGAKELLDEVATGKVTGEEDRYSHTDLSDFNANIEGAKEAYQLLKPVAAEQDPELSKTLDSEFADMQGLLAKYRQGNGFVPYDKVGQQERRAFSDAVNALAEPLSKLAAAVAP